VTWIIDSTVFKNFIFLINYFLFNKILKYDIRRKELKGYNFFKKKEKKVCKLKKKEKKNASLFSKESNGSKSSFTFEDPTWL